MEIQHVGYNSTRYDLQYLLCRIIFKAAGYCMEAKYQLL